MPERLRYLQPFRKYLLSLPAEKVGDGTDTSQLEEILHKRIKNLSVEEARRQLSGDLRELEEFLSQRRNDRLQFVVGFLIVATETPERLLEPAAKPNKRALRVIMDLPPGAKASVTEYSLIVKWKRVTLIAGKMNMDDPYTREHTLAELEQPTVGPNEQPPLRVMWGSATGHKQTWRMEAPKPWQRNDYLLKVPGGCVHVTIDSWKLFDETEWEPYLASLRIEPE